MRRETRPLRFAPDTKAPVDGKRADEIDAMAKRLGEFVGEMLITIDTLRDENDRLQDGIDTHLEKCAVLRGDLGRAEQRARLAEKLIALIDPARLEHESTCERGGTCTCGTLELRAQLSVAQQRIAEGLHV